MDQNMLGASDVANRSGLSRFNHLRGLMHQFSLRVMRLIVGAETHRIIRIIDDLAAPHMILYVRKYRKNRSFLTLWCVGLPD
ncbi:MAG: hypothetical protein ACI807_002186 [Paracoccaceae bacterium]|jgi:hypothetical protein